MIPGLVIMRRMHRCEVCEQVFDCDLCLDAMAGSESDSGPPLYAPEHFPNPRHLFVFVCQKCVQVAPL